MKKSKTINKTEIVDFVIPFIGISFIVVSFIYVFTYFGQLPEEIPIHYGLDGIPDDYGNKSAIWSIPILSLLLFIGLNYLSKFETPPNFSAKNLVKNARYLKKIKYRFMQVLNAIIAFIFFFLTYKTVQIGLDNDTDLGSCFIYLVFAGLIIPIVVYTILFFRKAF